MCHRLYINRHWMMKFSLLSPDDSISTCGAYLDMKHCWHPSESQSPEATNWIRVSINISVSCLPWHFLLNWFLQYMQMSTQRFNLSSGYTSPREIFCLIACDLECGDSEHSSALILLNDNGTDAWPTYVPRVVDTQNIKL